MRALLLPALICATALAAPALSFPIETTTALNLRSGPSSAYPVLARMPSGEVVHLDYCQGTWCRVLFRGSPGWASADHLARIPGRPFPWEGAERADIAYPFDRAAIAAPSAPGDVLREAAPVVVAIPPAEAAPVAPPAAVEAAPAPVPPRVAAIEPVPAPPVAPPPIAGPPIGAKVKVVGPPPAPAPQPRETIIARDRDADGAVDAFRRIGPRGAGGQDVL